MNNSDKPAMPATETVVSADRLDGPLKYIEKHYKGLTKREHFAAMAMQGLLSSQTINNGKGCTGKELSRLAIGAADSLLKELEK